ncbi:hypothetical protein EV127DRAFT_449129 [Xylaria flabelliformis]|nr:hypothetical protein EV127DRAFT_449129 [Xylaria flabelliformis]
MDPTPPKKDSKTGEEFRLLYHFTIDTKNFGFNLQVFTRKWYNFSERQPDHAIPTLIPLGRLPPEIRFMIYDLIMPPTRTIFDLTRPLDYLSKNLSSDTQRPFAVPKIAHICREMRQYAMRRYRLIWFRYAIDTYRYRLKCDTDNWKPVQSRFGVFDPAKDLIEILVQSIKSTDNLRCRNRDILWRNPFREPKLIGETWYIWNEPERDIEKELFLFKSTERGYWQRKKQSRMTQGLSKVEEHTD